MIIGLTGQTGAGKSTVSQFLKKKGMFVIDCDIVYRELTQKGSPLVLKLAQHFGNEILFEDKSLNRQKLAEIAFSGKDKTELLNSITHPEIIRELCERIRQNQGKIIVLDAPTLFESGAYKLCDKIISVVANKNMRLERIIRRDDILPVQAEKRIAAQMDEVFFIENSDAVIENNLGQQELINAVNKALMDIGVM